MFVQFFCFGDLYTHGSPAISMFVHRLNEIGKRFDRDKWKCHISAFLSYFAPLCVYLVDFQKKINTELR